MRVAPVESILRPIQPFERKCSMVISCLAVHVRFDYADARGMMSRSCISTAIQSARALSAYRGRHFQGYAVRSAADGWVCVLSTGMSWSKSICRTFEDARTLFRTMSHVQRFDVYDDVDDLNAIIDALPPFQRPSILPMDLPAIANRLPKLQPR